jgi:hypothetical protein
MMDTFALLGEEVRVDALLVERLDQFPLAKGLTERWALSQATPVSRLMGALRRKMA